MCGELSTYCWFFKIKSNLIDRHQNGKLKRGNETKINDFNSNVYDARGASIEGARTQKERVKELTNRFVLLFDHIHLRFYTFRLSRFYRLVFMCISIVILLCAKRLILMRRVHHQNKMGIEHHTIIIYILPQKCLCSLFCKFVHLFANQWRELCAYICYCFVYSQRFYLSW